MAFPRIDQCQMVYPENIHRSNIIQTEQVIFRNVYVYSYTHVHVRISGEKEAMNLKESGEGYLEELGGSKWKGEML